MTTNSAANSVANKNQEDRRLVKTGAWGGNIAWELYETDALPPKRLCTAVMCVAVAANDKIVLTRTGRGWGMLGGHIEEGESLEDALRREAHEEGGFIIGHCQPFAVRKITANEKHPTKDYPFPISYMVYYWATTTQPLIAPTGTEVLESASFSMDEMMALRISDQTEIEVGYEVFRRRRSLNGTPAYIPTSH